MVDTSVETRGCQDRQLIRIHESGVVFIRYDVVVEVESSGKVRGVEEKEARERQVGVQLEETGNDRCIFGCIEKDKRRTDRLQRRSS